MKKAQKVLCIAHKKPDGDTLGCTVALWSKLRDLGKECDIACIDAPSDRFKFLPGLKNIKTEFDRKDYDLIFVVDAGASYMTKYDQIYPDIFDGAVEVVNIDHHASNDNFGTVNIVDVQSASTSVIVYKLFKFLNLKITPEIATALLTGIYNDTGSLMHQNTTLEVFEICSDLMAAGAKVALISDNMFRNTPVSTLKVWGKVLERAEVNDQGVTVSVVTTKDLDEIGASSDEISGVVDFLNSVPGTKFTVLLNEDEKGNVKGSFRTRNDDVDLAELASRFGGGGHKKAAGFTMPGRLHREIRWRVVPDLEQLPEGAEVPKLTSSSPEAMVADTLDIPVVKDEKS